MLGDGTGVVVKVLYVSRMKPTHPAFTAASINKANNKSPDSFNCITPLDNVDYIRDRKDFLE
jgi:hypothetical protein